VRRAAAALAGLAMGCTTLAPYAPPGHGPRAEVRFVAATLGGTIDVVALDAAACDASGRRIALLHDRQPADVRPVLLPDGAFAPAPTAFAAVTAGRRFDALVQSEGLLDGWYPYACAAAVSFTPDAGERYELVYVNTDPYRCRIDVWRAGTGHARSPVEEARSEVCPLRAYRVRH
jgi:hypothetical protein